MQISKNPMELKTFLQECCPPTQIISLFFLRLGLPHVLTTVVSNSPII